MTELAAPVPLLLDVDTGIDDALALLYACASPEAEIVAVTCVAGNVAARQVAENTRAVLELAGRDDVEVALGRETPLVRPLVTTPETHGPKGIGYAVLPPPRRPLSGRHAADLIVDEARRRPGEVTLVTLGPATNLAVALLRDPELPVLLRRWVLMGGSYRSPGNTAPTTEWNASVDPEAMQACIAALSEPAVVGRRTAAGLPALPLALGLDVTERAKLLPDHLAALAQRAGSRPDPARDEAAGSVAGHAVVRFVDDALRFYMEFHSRFDGFYGAFIHDPLAVAAALDDGLVRAEELAVEVELGGTLTTGETVTDWRRTWGRPPTLAKRGSGGDTVTGVARHSSADGSGPPGRGPRRRPEGSQGTEEERGSMAWLSRQFSTRVIALIPVAIAINIVLGFTVQKVLNLPIYLDSVGTILVGVLAGPIAGALTGAASNLIWQYAPVIGPGSNIGPFAITSVVIGLLAGLWGWLGVFRSRPAEGPRLWASVVIGVAVIALLVLPIVGNPAYTDPNIGGYPEWVFSAAVVIAIAFAVVLAAAALLRRDSAGVWVALAGAVTGIVAAIVSAPIAAIVYEGVTGSGTDLIVAALRQGGADVMNASLGQGLISDPIDKTITSFVVFLVLFGLSRRFVARFPMGERLVGPAPD